MILKSYPDMLTNAGMYRLGEHPMSVTAMYSFLLDRHHASDVDGVLTTNILKVVMCCFVRQMSGNNGLIN